MLGQNIISINNGSSTLAFAADAVTGDVDAAAIVSHIGGGTGYGVILNDNSGNALTLVDPAAEDRPVWAGNVLGGYAALTSDPLSANANDGELSILGATLPAFSSAGFTLFFVAKGAFSPFPTIELGWDNGSQMTASGIAGTTHSFCYATTDPSFNEIGGESTDTPNTGTYFLWEIVFSNGTLLFLKNGVLQTNGASYDTGDLDPVSDTGIYVLRFCRAGTATGIVEAMGWYGVLSSGDRSLVRNNIMTKYGLS